MPSGKAAWALGGKSTWQPLWSSVEVDVVALVVFRQSKPLDVGSPCGLPSIGGWGSGTVLGAAVFNTLRYSGLSPVQFEQASFLSGLDRPGDDSIVKGALVSVTAHGCNRSDGTCDPFNRVPITLPGSPAIGQTLRAECRSSVILVQVRHLGGALGFYPREYFRIVRCETLLEMLSWNWTTGRERPFLWSSMHQTMAAFSEQSGSGKTQRCSRGHYIAYQPSRNSSVFP
jgi:hypothetical protein